MIHAIDARASLDAARDEEIRRGNQLLVAAQNYYAGDMTEDDFAGFICRYGAACEARRMLLAETNPASRKN